MTTGMNRPVRAAITSAFFALVMAALAGCSFQDEEKIWEISGGIFGTRYHINVVLHEDEERLRNLASGIQEELQSVDQAMSTWKDDSELSRFNQKSDQSQWTEVSGPLFEVLSEARRIAEMTDGALDITIGPVVNLWGFGPDARPETVPGEDALTRALAETGWQHLELDAGRQAIRSEIPLYLDLSAIAKGYGVDVVARYLDKQGVAAYLVEVGGEVRVNGRKPDGSAWKLAVEQPVENGREVNRIVALESQAMATSGDYRNYYESEGQRYSHTIDPKTGRPIQHRLASVTVISESSMTADGLATAFNVMGHERAMALATRENIPAYFIVRAEDGGFESHQTPAFGSYRVQ
ncbi:thiamine biosynthesis lipoprotein [Marinobacter persicus]|uniref:FAD:protein FMN transferase n=1 Tax=Marinobacter persicus TaxID=930118 RepID=A0A1I3S5E1_9GAMM|nr:FAD:protein FMN transferase [Marinobacter persicus]GHD45039.1 FAD:protein FMN transferase [Marinobacter persicus]SFJ54014.1 thiamine biosynthesis lipoprotein [Marinobacter persicus]